MNNIKKDFKRIVDWRLIEAIKEKNKKKSQTKKEEAKEDKKINEGGK